MIHKIYSIRDAAAEYYAQPFMQRAEGEATRNLQHLVNDPKSTVYQFPEQYDLYYLGEFDDNTGTFAGLDTPRHVVKAVHLKQATDM